MLETIRVTGGIPLKGEVVPVPNKNSSALLKMLYSDIKNITCVGVGGGLVYYTALFFHLMGGRVTGFDQSRNQRTKDLEQLGIKVVQANPQAGSDYHADLVIYTSSLPSDLLESFKNSNQQTLFMEVGEFTLKLLEDYANQKLSKKEKLAFLNSGVAPLYKLDLQGIPVVGVTGTDGKTTTCEMLYHLLSKVGFCPAVVTTVSAKCGDVEVDTGFHTTTPSAQELYALLKKFKVLGCTHIVLEVTSHALAMGRVAGLKFDVVVFTNVTQDHFDYHKTWENYIYAKSLLITKNLKETGTVVLTKADSKSYTYLAKLISRKQNIIALDSQNITVKGNQTIFEIDDTPVTLNVLGDYNVQNALSALGAILGLKLISSFPKLCGYFADFNGVAGRMQVLQREPFMVIVDFAHTPNALEKALTSVRKLVQGDKGKVIVVFGCAGNRDASKRPLMGAVAKKHADITILTAEDPRTEDISKINAQIKTGWDDAQGTGMDIITVDIDSMENRGQAIKKALEIAKPGDVVIFCGKGHEKSLCFGTTEHPWSDIEEVKKALRR